MRALLLILLVAVPCAHAEEDEPYIPEDLDAAMRVRLAEQKVLLGRRPFRQVFTPYIESKLPVFITSDSILHAYHVLLEDSVQRLERRRARDLAGNLRYFLSRLDAGAKGMELNEELVARGRRRVTLVLQVALGLLGEEVPAEVAAEVRRVEAAEGQHKPAFLGPPDPGFRALDYGRFRPVSFYAGTDRLRRYFRAVAWLQAVPFRAAPDEELVAFVLLQRGLHGEDVRFDRRHRRHVEAHRIFRTLVGCPDDPTVLDNEEPGETFTAEDLRVLRDAWRKRRPSLPDRVMDGPDLNSPVAGRVLGTARVPDAALFHRLVERELPADGLALCAALGSSWARAQIGTEALAIVDSGRDELDPRSLYTSYLRCVAALLDGPDADAPAFLKSEAWQIKSCQTALAGWAQLRHTWTLQAKVVRHYLGLTDKEPGFVEPDPEFFARLANLIWRTRARFDAAGAFDSDLDRLELADTLRRGARVIANAGLDEPEWTRGLGRDDATALQDTETVVRELGLKPKEYRFEGQEFLAVHQRAEKLANELIDLDRRLEPRVREVVQQMSFAVEPRWRDLERISRELESLAHRQLRNIPFTDQDRQFFRRYGEHLAWIEFYEGNSFLTPRDDAPRATAITFDPRSGSRRHVAVGRARALYVLYPTTRGEVLCRGAVMSYYEFDAATPATDAEWKAKLDAKERPAQPPWLDALRIPGELLPIDEK